MQRIRLLNISDQAQRNVEMQPLSSVDVSKAKTQKTKVADFDVSKLKTQEVKASHGKVVPMRAQRPRRSLIRNSTGRHLLLVLKMLCITTFFLVDLPIEFVLLAHTPTYQIVDLVIILVLYSNAIGITIQRHYHITVDLKRTLRLKSAKTVEKPALKVHPSKYEHLSSIHDTTAYLKALKLIFLEKEQWQ